MSFKSIFKLVFWFFIFPLTYTFCLYFLDGNHQAGSFFVLICVFFISFVFFRNNKNTSFFKGLSLIILPLIVTFLVILKIGGSYKISVYVLFTPITFYLGWRFKRTKNFKFIIYLLFVCFFASLIYIPNKINYELNRNSETIKKMSDIIFLDKNNEQVKLSKDKIIVLDFWSTSCVVCYDKFPEFENFYLEYKANNSIEFYSVNVAERRDTFTKTLRLVDDLDYQFKTIYIKSMKEVQEKLDIYSFPELMIIKNDSIRFQGYLNTNWNILIKNSKNELRKIIEN